MGKHNRRRQSREESLIPYTGSPGIAYYLLKAASWSPEPLQAARKGMSHILTFAKRDDKGLHFDFKENPNGVFEGNAGIGYLFLYAHHVTGELPNIVTAEQIAKRIAAIPDVKPLSSPDIISGAAGRLPTPVEGCGIKGIPIDGTLRFVPIG